MTKSKHRDAIAELASKLTPAERSCLMQVANGETPNQRDNEGALATLINAFLIELDRNWQTLSATKLGAEVAAYCAEMTFNGEAAA